MDGMVRAGSGFVPNCWAGDTAVVRHEGWGGGGGGQLEVGALRVLIPGRGVCRIQATDLDVQDVAFVRISNRGVAGGLEPRHGFTGTPAPGLCRAGRKVWVGVEAEAEAMVLRLPLARP